MRIYVASSWRNERQPAVVAALREAGHEVYDFRNPEPGNTGFRWTDVEPEWKTWSPERFRTLLRHPVAESGFRLDMDALERCDACLMLLPCGRSASLEMGYAIGAGKLTLILLADGEPELMFKMADHICLDVEEVVQILACPHCGRLGGWVDSDPPEYFRCDCPAAVGPSKSRGIVTSGAALGVCSRCEGCGQVANTADEEPWTAWSSLPHGSDIAVLAGLVKPKPCPECGGAAKEHAHA